MCPRTERGAGPRGSLTLISGGAASGKSEYAEQTAVAAGGPRYYLATMQVWDEESRRRVEKHRAMRAGKGFATVECPENLAAVDLPPTSASARWAFRERRNASWPGWSGCADRRLI